MEIPVLVERVEGNGFRARSGEPLVVAAEGATQEEVLRKVREQLESRMAAGANLVSVTVPPPTEHPSASLRGNWTKDDPVIQRWKQYVEEYRQQIEDDPEHPMTKYVLDTDTLSLYRAYDPVVERQVNARLADEVAISVITVEEQLSGWYTYVRKATQPDEVARGYKELADSIPFLAKWKILPYSETVIARYEQLVKLKLNVRKMDLRIAAIALENHATVVTRNLRDFQRVPNLPVVDWSI